MKKTVLNCFKYPYYWNWKWRWPSLSTENETYRCPSLCNRRKPNVEPLQLKNTDGQLERMPLAAFKHRQQTFLALQLGMSTRTSIYLHFTWWLRVVYSYLAGDGATQFEDRLNTKHSCSSHLHFHKLVWLKASWFETSIRCERNSSCSYGSWSRKWRLAVPSKPSC